jgi:uncharacterized protein (TIGR00266 family)
MKYEIIGGNLPAVICHMSRGEKIVCESGGMSWMDDAFTMETSGGGIGKMFGRMFSGETMFRNIYTANRDGDIAFSSSFPGQIIAVQVTPGNPVIAQKRAFLACDPGVETSVFFQKKLGSGIFGGEGFIMQKFEGNGIVLLEVDGSIKEYNLAAGQRIIMDTGHLVMMEGTCSMDIERIKGAKNIVFGGEGLFNTVVSGPGKITIQTMPIEKTVQLLSRLMPSNGSN